MQNQADINIKQLILRQDESLERELPNYVFQKIYDSLDGKTSVDDIKLKKLFGFKATKLKNALKAKLQRIMNADQKLTLKDAFLKLHEEEKSWMNWFLRICSKIFSLRAQEKLVIDIAQDLPQDMAKALKDAIDSEKNNIIKGISGNGYINGLSAVEEQAAPRGEAVHEVNKYKDDQGKLFFVKDVTYGFKGIMYRLFTGIGNEGIREAIGGAFYHAMGLNNSAEVGIIKDTSNKAIKIYSKAVGDEGDKICSLGQLLKGWNFDGGKLDESQKIGKPAEWLNKPENSNLKKEIMKAHAVSMLIGNRDLKNDNIMIIKKLDGTLQCAPIDFGLSGHKISSLRTIKGMIHFDTTLNRHKDSVTLFEQDEYKHVLKEVVEDFRVREKDILESVYKRCEALKDVGFQGHQYKTLIRNIQSNVRVAEQMCGIGAASGVSLGV